MGKTDGKTDGTCFQGFGDEHDAEAVKATAACRSGREGWRRQRGAGTGQGWRGSNADGTRTQAREAGGGNAEGGESQTKRHGLINTNTNKNHNY